MAAVDDWVVVAVLEMTQLYVRLLRVLAAIGLNFLKKSLVVELEEQVLLVQLRQLVRSLLLLIETEGEVAQQIVKDRQCNFQQDDQRFHRMNKIARDGELLLQHEQEKVRWKKAQEEQDDFVVVVVEILAVIEKMEEKQQLMEDEFGLEVDEMMLECYSQREQDKQL